jgi:hypothetical protein
MDNTLTMDGQITHICKSASFSIRTESTKIRKCLSFETSKVLVLALVTSKLDQYNSLLYGLPQCLIQRFQYVQNSAARLVTLSRKYDISPLLTQLTYNVIGYPSNAH